MAGLESRMVKLANRAEVVTQRMHAIEELEIPTDKYQKLEDELSGLKNQYEAIKAKKQELLDMGFREDSGGIASFNEKLAAIEKTMEAVHQKQQALKDSGEAFVDPKTTEGYAQAEAKLREINADMSATSKQIGALELKTKQFGKESRRSFTAFSKHAGKATNSMGSLARRIMTLAKSVFIFRVISQAFRNMLNGFKDGLKSYAKYSAEYNKSMSGMASASSQLKNSLAAAVGPILNIVAPALTTMINLITRATQAVSQFIAAITGKSTWTRAKKQQIDYAKSLDNTSKAADKAKTSLAGFDDLDILQKDGSGSGATGGGEVTGAGAFEEVPLNKSLAQLLKDMWDRGDLTEMGTYIGQKLKEALDSIQWGLIQKSARMVAKRIATLLNGFIETEGLGQTIGHTLGESINTGLTAMNSFFKNFHFDSLGKFITNGIQAAFQTIDWGMLGNSLSLLAQGLFDFLRGAIQGINWREVPRDIATAIRNVLTEFDWTGTFGSLGQFAGALSAAVVEAVLGLKDMIGEAWDNVVTWWNGHAMEDGHFVIEGLLTGIMDAVADIKGWIWEHILTPFIDGFKEAFQINSPSKVMAELGGYIVAGLLNALQEIPQRVKQIITNAVSQFKNCLNEFLKYVKTSFVEGWRSAWRGIATVLCGIVNNMISMIEHLINNIIDGINAMLRAAVSLANKIPGVHFDAPEIPHWSAKRIPVPELANGGITTGSTLARIGEAGREAVLPLENNLDYLDKFADKIAERIPAAQTGPAYLQVDGKTFARLMRPYSTAEDRRVGLSFT